MECKVQIDRQVSNIYGTVSNIFKHLIVQCVSENAIIDVKNVSEMVLCVPYQ